MRDLKRHVAPDLDVVQALNAQNGQFCLPKSMRGEMSNGEFQRRLRQLCERRNLSSEETDQILQKHCGKKLTAAAGEETVGLDVAGEVAGGTTSGGAAAVASPANGGGAPLAPTTTGSVTVLPTAGKGAKNPLKSVLMNPFLNFTSEVVADWDPAPAYAEEISEVGAADLRAGGRATALPRGRNAFGVRRAGHADRPINPALYTTCGDEKLLKNKPTGGRRNLQNADLLPVEFLKSISVHCLSSSVEELKGTGGGGGVLDGGFTQMNSLGSPAGASTTSIPAENKQQTLEVLKQVHDNFIAILSATGGNTSEMVDTKFYEMLFVENAPLRQLIRRRHPLPREYFHAACLTETVLKMVLLRFRLEGSLTTFQKLCWLFGCMKKQFARIIAVSEKEAREKVDRHAKVARSLSESMEIVSEKNMEAVADGREPPSDLETEDPLDNQDEDEELADMQRRLKETERGKLRRRSMSILVESGRVNVGKNEKRAAEFVSDTGINQTKQHQRDSFDLRDVLRPNFGGLVAGTSQTDGSGAGVWAPLDPEEVTGTVLAAGKLFRRQTHPAKTETQDRQGADHPSPLASFLSRHPLRQLTREDWGIVPIPAHESPY
eukprot:g18448.t1